MKQSKLSVSYEAIKGKGEWKCDSSGVKCEAQGGYVDLEKPLKKR